MSEKIIEIRKLTYVYPDGTKALDKINLSVIEGESIALVGRNGAGKSTLLLHLNGLLSPTKGSVFFKGESLSEKNIHEVRAQVGILFQDPDDQLFMPTVYEDVAFGPKNMGLTQEEASKRTEKALSLVGLSGFEKRSPHHLSFGERKRAAIATILSMNPKVLLLDEPTLGLDPWVKKEFTELLKNLMREHTTILATHDLELAQTSDRVYLMDRGRLQELEDKRIRI